MSPSADAGQDGRQLGAQRVECGGQLALRCAQDNGLAGRLGYASGIVVWMPADGMSSPVRARNVWVVMALASPMAVPGDRVRA